MSQSPRCVSLWFVGGLSLSVSSICDGSHMLDKCILRNHTTFRDLWSKNKKKELCEGTGTVYVCELTTEGTHERLCDVSAAESPFTQSSHRAVVKLVGVPWQCFCCHGYNTVHRDHSVTVGKQHVRVPTSGKLRFTSRWVRSENHVAEVSALLSVLTGDVQFHGIERGKNGKNGINCLIGRIQRLSENKKISLHRNVLSALLL